MQGWLKGENRRTCGKGRPYLHRQRSRSMAGVEKQKSLSFSSCSHQPCGSTAAAAAAVRQGKRGGLCLIPGCLLTTGAWGLRRDVALQG